VTIGLSNHTINVGTGLGCRLQEDGKGLGDVWHVTGHDRDPHGCLVVRASGS